MDFSAFFRLCCSLFPSSWGVLDDSPGFSFFKLPSASIRSNCNFPGFTRRWFWYCFRCLALRSHTSIAVSWSWENALLLDPWRYSPCRFCSFGGLFAASCSSGGLPSSVFSIPGCGCLLGFFPALSFSIKKDCSGLDRFRRTSDSSFPTFRLSPVARFSSESPSLVMRWTFFSFAFHFCSNISLRFLLFNLF